MSSAGGPRAAAQSIESRAAPARWRWWLPAAVVTLGAIVAQRFYLPNDDATWLMSVARRMMEGGTLYSADLVEINPPLIIWMTWLAVRVADLTGAEAITAWRLLVSAAVVGSLWLSARALSASTDPDDADVGPLLLTSIAAVFACLPAYQFGQREHFIVLWLTPYLLATAASLAGDPAPAAVRRIAGVLLGLALALKPHYVVAVLLVEAAVVAHQRTPRALVRPVLVSGAAVCAAYLVAIAVFSPGFFGVAVPLALRYYHSYSELQFQPIHLVYGVAVVFAVALTSQPRVAALRCRLLALAGAGAYVAYLVQDRGWPYHFLPAKTFFLLSIAGAVAAVAHRRLEALRNPATRPLALRAASLAMVLVTVGFAWQQAWAFQGTRQARIVRNVERYLAGIDFGPGERRFAALSLTLFPAFPVTELVQARWCSRFSCLWILPGVIEAETRLASNGPPDPAGRPYLETAVCDDFD